MDSEKRPKRALVLEGGGLRGAFTAGVMSAFYEQGIGYGFFDYYIGSSAGAWSIAYFLTEQIEEGLRIWKDHLHSKLFGWRLGKPNISLDHLEWVARDKEPLDIRILPKRNVQAFAVLSDIETGLAHYENICRAPDPVAVLKAAVAMPFLAKPVTLYGHRYCDGGMTDAVPVCQAEKAGAKEIWVVTPLPKGFRRNVILWKWILRFASFDPKLRKLFITRPEQENLIREEIEKRDDLVVIRPDFQLPVSWMRGDREAVEASIEAGRNIGFGVLKEKKLI